MSLSRAGEGKEQAQAERPKREEFILIDVTRLFLNHD